MVGRPHVASWIVASLAGCVGDIVGPSGQAADTAAAGLAIANLEPASGPTAGGTLVRISGSGFTAQSAIAVGGAACTDTTWLSQGELLCLTPPGEEGEATLSVSEGSEEATADFAYLGAVEDTAAPDTGDGPPTLSSCVLLTETMESEAREYTPAASAAVTVPGRTDGEGEGVGIEGQFGFGASGSPTEGWEWQPAAYLSSDGDTDIYDDETWVEEPGDYSFTFRFRVDHGDWTLCTTGSGGWGALSVAPSSEELPVDYCHVQWPCSTTVAVGAESEEIYAWIFQYDVTMGEGAGEGIWMDLGLGDDGSDPDSDPSWRWWPMSYNMDKDGMIEGDKANDEYVGTFTAPMSAGSYDYAARASADYGITWTLCDLGGDSCNFGGSTDGYDDPGECIVE